MKEYKTTIRFSILALKESFRSILTYLVFIISFLIIQFLCSGIGDYLKETNDSMNIFEIYTWFMSTKTSQMFYLLGILVLAASASFFFNGAAYYLLRLNRKVWIKSQIIHFFILLI